MKTTTDVESHETAGVTEAPAGSALSARLRARARSLVRELDEHPTGGKLVRGTLGTLAYVRYLTQVVHQVRGSAPMLHAAAALLGDRPEFADHFREKGHQESGHDQWARADAVSQGASGAAIDRAAPSAAVVFYHALIRFLLEHRPIAIFGLAYTLEWLGKERAGMAADNLVKNGGIPEAAVSFLRGHSDADVEHIAALEAVLDRITDPVEARMIELSAELTGVIYLAFFDGIEEPGPATTGCLEKNARV